MTGKRLIASGLVCAGLLGGVGVTGQIHADITQDSSATYNDTTDDSYSDIPDMGITVTNDVDDSTSDSNDTGSDTGDTTEDSNTDESTTTDTDQDSTNTDVTSNTDSSNTTTNSSDAANSSISTDVYATYESRNRLWDVINASVPILNRGNYYDDWSKIYTKTSYHNLDKGYYYGFKINKESNPTQAEVDKAYAQLTQALRNLEKYKGSKEQKETIAKAKASLLKTIKKAKSKTNKGYPKYRQTKNQGIRGGRYNYFRFKKMKKALKNASKLYKDSKASAKSLNRENKKLNSTLKNLIDQKEYYKAMKKYDSDSIYNYTIPTAATWSMLTDNLFADCNAEGSIYDFTQKDLDYDIKMFYTAVNRLKKHHWRKDTNKLWGKINKKTGKFYYNRDRWGQKVSDYLYYKKDKNHKNPYLYVVDIHKKHSTQYVFYSLRRNALMAVQVKNHHVKQVKHTKYVKQVTKHNFK